MRARAESSPVLQEGVVCADNLPFMGKLDDGCCDLIYIDPPFPRDHLPNEEVASLEVATLPSDPELARHLKFIHPRLVQMHRLLSDRGSLYVHLDWQSVHYVKVMLDELFGSKQFLNEIVWSYRSGARPAPWFARKHDTLLLYAKRLNQHTFNRMRGGEYRTQGLKTAPDGRLYKSTRKGPIYFDPAGPALSDVWEMPFLSTVSKERCGYLRQKPLALLERVIRASSNEGDVVADFFCGSGTTLVAAKRLKRRFVGCDVNPEAVVIANRRLAETKSDK